MYTVPPNPRPRWWRPQWEHLHVLALAFDIWLHGARINNVRGHVYTPGSGIAPCQFEREFLSACFSGIAIGVLIAAGIYLSRGDWRGRIMARFYLATMILTGIMLLEPRLSSLGITAARDACTALLQHRIS